ncbi:hypothetical protein [Streptomyces sp. NPDC055243]|uniref:hypothetical protein n=1 Tax=Streptomyces sp. NPDC055243 TaxID=3365720 RepID=UPI0037D2FCB7
MATQIVPVPLGADHPTAPLPFYADRAVRRLELAFAPQVVVNFDRFGSLWGVCSVAEIESDIAEARADGVAVDEWATVDRDGSPLRIVRIAESGMHGGIHAFTVWNGLAEQVAK